MKKLISGVVAGLLLSAGVATVEAATVSSNAAVVTKADKYGPQMPDVTRTVANVKASIKAGVMTPVKAKKLIVKLRNYEKLGLISKAKFKKFKKKIKNAL
jgi:hypothetical protein